MADSYEINLEIQGGGQPDLDMQTENGATDGASARNAEAWAVGKRNGADVPSTDPTYHNNAKYYATDAAASAADAAASAAEAEQYTPEAIHTWLEENIDPDSGYALDRTLSEKLAAAPADMVGDLKSALSFIETATTVEIENVLSTEGRGRWTITDTTVAFVENTSTYNYALKPVPVESGDIVHIILNASQGDSVIFAHYENNVYTVVSTESFSQGDDVDRIFEIENNVTHILLTKWGAGGTPCANFIVQKTDKSLENENVPADAKTTGEKFIGFENVVNSIKNLDTILHEYQYTLEAGAINSSGINTNVSPFGTSSCRTAEYVDLQNANQIHVAYERSPDATLPSGSSHYYLYVFFYRSDKTFISREGGSDILSVIAKVPENAKYVRISFTNTKEADLVSNSANGYELTTLVKTVNELNTRIPTNGIVLGDSISFGLWSYWDGNLRKNADDLYPGDISKTAAPIRISDWLAVYYGIQIDNIAKRGTGWVADTRNLGNAWEKAQATDFSNYDFAALCFGVNDYINKKPLGTIADNTIGTVIGNMIHVLEKIYADNPLIKVVVFSPLNTWGQYRDSESSPKVLYGDASTHYALGYDFNGSSYTLQALIDAMESVCDRYDVRHVVMSQGCTINVFNIKDILIDGLHPSQESMKSIASDMYHAMMFR